MNNKNTQKNQMKQNHKKEHLVVNAYLIAKYQILIKLIKVAYPVNKHP